VAKGLWRLDRRRVLHVHPAHGPPQSRRLQPPLLQSRGRRMIPATMKRIPMIQAVLLSTHLLPRETRDANQGSTRIRLMRISAWKDGLRHALIRIRVSNEESQHDLIIDHIHCTSELIRSNHDKPRSLFMPVFVYAHVHTLSIQSQT